MTNFHQLLYICTYALLRIISDCFINDDEKKNTRHTNENVERKKIQKRKKYNRRKLMETKPYITNQRNKRHIS